MTPVCHCWPDPIVLKPPLIYMDFLSLSRLSYVTFPKAILLPKLYSMSNSWMEEESQAAAIAFVSTVIRWAAVVKVEG